MKPSATQFEEASKDASDKLKPEGIEAMFEKAREYEQKIKAGKADKLPLTEEEYQTWMRDVWLPYLNLVNKATAPIAKTEVDIEFEPLSEEAFGKLMASNDWMIKQADMVGELIIE
jgi:arsenate reductase-like glutaredoxin family protein